MFYNRVCFTSHPKRGPDAAAEDATAVNITAEDGTAEDSTAELSKKGGRYGGI